MSHRAKRGYILINEDGETIDRQTAIDIKKEYDDFMKEPDPERFRFFW